MEFAKRVEKQETKPAKTEEEAVECSIEGNKIVEKKMVRKSSIVSIQ